MARRADLMREISELRRLAGLQYSRIDVAIQKGRLPKSAKGTYFYDVVTTQKTVKGSYLTIKLPKLKNVELEKVAAKLRNLTGQRTATQVGIRESLRERAENAEIQLNLAGLDPDEISAMTRYQKSRFFQLANLLREELDYESEAAFVAVAETMHSSGKQPSELFREFNKNVESFTEKYGLKRGKKRKK